MRARYLMPLLFVSVCGLLAGQAAAQQKPTLPPDLAAVPEVIRSGEWKHVNLSDLTPLEHCQSLLLLNHVLDELAPLAAAHADLMSTYLDEQSLGHEFTEHGPPLPPPRFTEEEGLKIAAALLRGPLADSEFSTALKDTNANGLGAYRQMYEATCARKWAEVTEAGRQLRCMGQFLKDTNRLAAYQEWAPAEVERREKQYEQEQAQRRASLAAARKEQQAQEEQARVERANEKRAAQQQQAEQALAAAQRQMSQPAAQPGGTVIVDDDSWGTNYYGAVSNVRRAAYSRDVAYGAAARNATSARISGWAGRSGGGGRGGRGR